MANAFRTNATMESALTRRVRNAANHIAQNVPRVSHAARILNVLLNYVVPCLINVSPNLVRENVVVCAIHVSWAPGLVSQMRIVCRLFSALIPCPHVLPFIALTLNLILTNPTWTVADPIARLA